MKNCMIIPTYWSTPDIDCWKVFDHPIPISEPGTLGRTLDNLEEVEYPDPVILFPAPTDPRIEAHVKKIASGRKIDIHVFSAADLKAIRKALKKKGFPKEFFDVMNMNSYGGVRNMGLIYAAMKGYDNTVLIDDDELIDRDYLGKALRDMGEKYDGTTVYGKTGCVVDKDGKKYYDGQQKFVLENWPKDQMFNINVKQALQSKKRLDDCIVAFGGNMVINRKMFLKVPFDPYGTRGEDDDYVLNARHCGMRFFFDKDLVLLHLPPERHGSFWTRHRQDIIRFKYTREKARVYGFEPKSLGIFMETFVQDDLEYRAVSSSIGAALQFADKDKNEFREFLNNAVIAEQTPVKQIHARAETFVRFMKAWGKVMPKIEG